MEVVTKTISAERKEERPDSLLVIFLLILTEVQPSGQMMDGRSVSCRGVTASEKRLMNALLSAADGGFVNATQRTHVPLSCYLHRHKPRHLDLFNHFPKAEGPTEI